MAIVYVFLFIIIFYSCLWLSMSKWETIMVGSLKEDGKEIFSRYNTLKQKKIRCKLIEKNVAVDYDIVWLLVSKDEYEHAKIYLEK